MNIVDAILMFAEMLVLYSNVYMYIDIFYTKTKSLCYTTILYVHF